MVCDITILVTFFLVFTVLISCVSNSVKSLSLFKAEFCSFGGMIYFKWLLKDIRRANITSGTKSHNTEKQLLRL